MTSILSGLHAELAQNEPLSLQQPGIILVLGHETSSKECQGTDFEMIFTALFAPVTRTVARLTSAKPPFPRDSCSSS